MSGKSRVVGLAIAAALLANGVANNANAGLGACKPVEVCSPVRAVPAVPVCKPVQPLPPACKPVRPLPPPEVCKPVGACDGVGTRARYAVLHDRVARFVGHFKRHGTGKEVYYYTPQPARPKRRHLRHRPAAPGVMTSRRSCSPTAEPPSRWLGSFCHPGDADSHPGNHLCRWRLACLTSAMRHRAIPAKPALGLAWTHELVHSHCPRQSRTSATPRTPPNCGRPIRRAPPAAKKVPTVVPKLVPFALHNSVPGCTRLHRGKPKDADAGGERSSSQVLCGWDVTHQFAWRCIALHRHVWRTM